MDELRKEIQNRLKKQLLRRLREFLFGPQKHVTETTQQEKTPPRLPEPPRVVEETFEDRRKKVQEIIQLAESLRTTAQILAPPPFATELSSKKDTIRAVETHCPTILKEVEALRQKFKEIYPSQRFYEYLNNIERTAKELLELIGRIKEGKEPFKWFSDYEGAIINMMRYILEEAHYLVEGLKKEYEHYLKRSK